jgi:glycerophosphoryl diester phosphodiesterase
VLAWTVDEVADLRRVVAAGADGVITNDPRIFDA